MTDDLDGTDADQTIVFAVDGVEYEIDLNTANANRLRADLEKWIGAARMLSRNPKSRGAQVVLPRQRDAWLAGGPTHSRRSETAGEYNRKVREWARAEGIKVAERGAVSLDVIGKYERAMELRAAEVVVPANGKPVQTVPAAAFQAA